MNWNSWDRSWLLKKKKHLYSLLFFCFSFFFFFLFFFFFITPTYFVILNFVFQIISGTSAGRAMLLFICLAFFYFQNAETSQCASMENQHTGIDSTLASIDRSVLAVDVRSVWTIFVLFFLSFFKKRYLRESRWKKETVWDSKALRPAQFLAIYKRTVFDLLWPFYL